MSGLVGTTWTITNVNALLRPDVPLPRRLDPIFVHRVDGDPLPRVLSLAIYTTVGHRRSDRRRPGRAGYFRELMQLMRRLTVRILARSRIERARSEYVN